MANNYIVTNTRFKPFSYQELLAPAQAATEYHQQLETEMDNLDIMAQDVGSKLDSTLDPNEYRAYSNFNKELTSAAEDLAKNGLNQNNRRKLAQLKSTYTKSINPIAEGYKKMVEYNDSVRKLSMTNPELIIQGDFRVRDFMGGNNPTPLTANKEDIYNKSMKEAAGASSRFSFIDDPTSALGSQYWMYKSGQGITQGAVDALNKFMNNVDGYTYDKLNEQSRALYDIVTRQRQQNGYDSFNSGNKNQIDAAILNGIFAGISYKDDVKYMSNQAYMNPLEQLKYRAAKDGLDNPPQESNTVWARNVDRVIVNPDGTKTTQVEADKKFLGMIQENPELLLQEANVPSTGSSLTGATYNYGNGKPSRPYEDKITEISKRYGLDIKWVETLGGQPSVSIDLNDNISKLRNVINSSAKAFQDYILNITDDSMAKTTIRENIGAHYSSSNKTGLREVKNGVLVKKEASIDDVNKLLEGDVTIKFSPGFGTIIIGEDGRSYKIDMSIIDSHLWNQEKLINDNFNSKNFREALKYINDWEDEFNNPMAGYNELLYRELHTKTPTPSTTTSKPIE